MANKMVRVVATKQGFDNLCIREPGDEFLMPEGVTGSWFHPVAEAGKPSPATTDETAEDLT